MGIEPEPQGHADSAGPRTEQRDGAVDAAAHRHRHTRRVRASPHRRSERVRERVDRKRLSSHRRRLEQREAAEVLGDAWRIGVNDLVAVDPKANQRPLRTAGGVSDQLLHAGQRTGGGSTEGAREPPPFMP